MNETPVSSPEAEFTAAQAVAAGTDFAELKVDDAGLFWVEFRPADDACRIWHWHHHQARCLTPDGFSVRSRVYEYGGGSFCLGGDGLVFVNEKDQQVYTQALENTPPRALTQDAACRYGDVQWHDGQVLAVEERHGETVEHRLVALADGTRQVLAEGADFYASPTISPDGQRLAWIEWNCPAQPWTVTRLVTRRREANGQWEAAQTVAAGDESLQQPRFDQANRLYCLSDCNGFWQPWGEVDGCWQALASEPADHASAPWQLGASTWLPLGPQHYLATWFEAGFGQLGLRTADGRTERFASAYTRFRHLAMDAACVYAIAASPISPPAVIAIARDSHEVSVLAGGAEVLPAQRISLPQSFHCGTGAALAHGFFYPAAGSTKPSPLIVFIHGGPTSACYPVLDPRIQFWTQRGFAVADLNYRGSSGYGREYRHALHLQWGQSDVEDACAAVERLAADGLIDKAKAFIRGGSAGGYTTLCALAFKDVFLAGASLYGVSDPIALARATHKFEGDYLDWLIGDPDQDAERYRQRTPLLHAERIKVPVVFFQGELDAVVVPEQTRAMVAALNANGIEALAHFYEGERHGFRKARNLEHALEQEWQFYCRVLGQQ